MRAYTSIAQLGASDVDGKHAMDVRIVALGVVVRGRGEGDGEGDGEGVAVGW